MNKKKIAIIGASGQVGFELARALSTVGEVQAYSRKDGDLADLNPLIESLAKGRFDIIINAAAYTGVDKAESEEQLCYQINAKAPARIASLAQKMGALFLHFSTDYVFDGQKAFGYIEEDQTAPLSVYGRSKREGEIAILESCQRAVILRTSWVYSLTGKNFLLTIEKLARKAGKEPLKIVNDQFGAPTWSRHLAEAALIIAATEPLKKGYGLFHLSSSGKTTWYGFAKAIIDILQLPASVTPITTAEYLTAAKRPANSLLDNTKIQKDYAIFLPDWQEALNLCLQSRTP